MDIKERLKKILDEISNRRRDAMNGMGRISKYNRGYDDGLKEAYFLIFLELTDIANVLKENKNN